MTIVIAIVLGIWAILMFILAENKEEVWSKVRGENDEDSRKEYR